MLLSICASVLLSSCQVSGQEFLDDLLGWFYLNKMFTEKVMFSNAVWGCMAKYCLLYPLRMDIIIHKVLAHLAVWKIT